ncbi:putative transcription factor C2H2 family [Helianthus debilis subsp. tardiflorus]
MAVQAHSSSNILLLNRTSLQQQQGIHHTGNNYSFPPQMFNNYPVVNQGKRRREDDNMNQFMSSLHQESYSNQLMDVSQIHSRNVDVSTGLRLAFNDHQHHHHHHSFDPQSSGFVSPSDFSDLINQQGDEIEHYLQAQGEELRRKLAEKRQRHYHALIGVVKESATRIIREKEAVVERAARRNAELEARATQLSAEAQVWEAKARAQEAVAAALQAELQQAVVAVTCVSQVEEVAAADAESSYIDPERVVVVSGPGCKACGKRVASVVLLPCRHLCVCSECDDVVQACPLCLSLRSSSIEVYMS